MHNTASGRRWTKCSGNFGLVANSVVAMVTAWDTDSLGTAPVVMATVVVTTSSLTS